MPKPVKLSEARSKMTRLDKILKPGDVMHITRRGKPYARLELITKPDRYDEVLKSIEALPEPKGKKQAIAQTYKTFLYEKSNGKKRNLFKASIPFIAMPVFSLPFFQKRIRNINEPWNFLRRSKKTAL